MALPITASAFHQYPVDPRRAEPLHSDEAEGGEGRRAAAMGPSQNRFLPGLCAAYSLTGILFMLWVCALFKFQPFYVGKIMADLDTFRSSARGALAAFVATFLVSLALLLYDANRHELDHRLQETLSSTGMANPLVGVVGRPRTGSHDSGSDGGGSSDSYSVDGMGGSGRRQESWGGYVRQRNPCFPDRGT